MTTVETTISIELNDNCFATVNVLNCKQHRAGQEKIMRETKRSHSSPDSATAIFVFCIVSLLICEKTTADLYTTNAASLEWKVDSADEVFLAEVTEDVDAKFGSRFHVLESLKANRELSTFPHETVHRCQLGRCLDPRSSIWAKGSRWIIFVRGDGNNARVSGAISLTHPTAEWTFAAISGFGKGDKRVLTKAEEIIDRVKQRIALDRPMAIDCDPDLTDQLCGGRYFDLPLGAWIGGKLLKTNIFHWDEPNEFGVDYDMLVNSLLVPVDVPQGEAIGQLSIADVHDTELIYLHGSSRDYFRHGQPEQNKSPLIGTWRCELADRMLTITFHHRLTCLYSMEMKDHADSPYLASNGGTVFGAGTWTVDGGFLNLRKNRRVEGRWHRGRSWMRHGEDDLPRGRIVSESDTEFQLADGTKFVRHNEPVNAYDHPHDHPCDLISEGWGLHRIRTTVEVTYTKPGQSEPKPLNDLVLMWRPRGSMPVQGPPRPKNPRTVRTILDDHVFEPRITVLQAGDTFEIEATGSRPIGDHNINLAWFNNGQRSFAPRLEPPLVYQEIVARGEPALMHIDCNIHDDEQGYLVVTEHGNVAVTNKDGFTTLSDWPIGEQRLTLIHPDYDLRDADVWADGSKVEMEGSTFRISVSQENIKLRLAGVKRHE